MANNNNRNTLNVPNLRFKEFQGEWGKDTFENVCSITTGNKNTQDKSDDGIYPFYVRSETIERINSYSFDGEAILTAGDGVGVGKIFHYVNGKVGVHQRVYILSAFNCHPKFAYYYFASRFFDRVSRMSAKNSVDSVRREMIANMPLYSPALNEQIKIATFLSLLDRRIETQIKIIEDLKLLKSTIRNKIFEEIRKSDFRKLKIRYLLEYEQPTMYIVENVNYSEDSTLIPVLTANKAFILGYTDEESGIYDQGDCIIFDDFTMDMKYVDFSFKIKSSAIKILTPKPEINLRYMFEYLSFLSLSSNDHKRHYISEVEDIIVPVPYVE
jgi:type I restriction enzyme S subunit